MSTLKSLVELFSNTEMVTIHVAGRTFIIHRDLLCAHSEYFRGAFMGKFKEAKERETTLTETTPEAFACFVNWIYRGSFEIDLGTGRSQGELDAGIRQAVEAYLFADRYESSSFRRLVLDAIICKILVTPGTTFTFNTARLACCSLSESSGLRKFVQDFFVHRWAPVSAKEMKGITMLPEDDIFEILFQKLHKRDGTMSLFPKPLCHYHEHKSEEERRTCEAASKPQ